MSRFRITTPLLGFTGPSAGGVNFTHGVAEIDAPEHVAQHPMARALAYFRAQGYGVEPLDEPASLPGLADAHGVWPVLTARAAHTAA